MTRTNGLVSFVMETLCNNNVLLIYSVSFKISGYILSVCISLCIIGLNCNNTFPVHTLGIRLQKMLYLHDISPQVRTKMNDKKPSKFQFYFSGVLEAYQLDTSLRIYNLTELFILRLVKVDNFLNFRSFLVGKWP